MKIINKIKAFFTHRNEPVELDLIAAEIKEGKAFLHPRGEEGVTYLIRSDDIEITLSKGRSLTPKDILKTGPKEKTTKNSQHVEKEKSKKSPEQTTNPNKSSKPALETTQTTENEFDRFKKRKFVVSLYPEEYDRIMTSMKEYGYKRADFVMACVNTASKGSMEKAHKKIVKAHGERLKEQKEVEARRLNGDTT